MACEPVCVVPIGDWCGEAPVWDDTAQAIYWTDINRFLIHRLYPASGEVKTWVFDEPVTALALTLTPGVLAVVLGSGLLLWTADSDRRSNHIFRLPGWPAFRLNDGRPDPRGSFWAGSMRNNVRPDGTGCECGGTDGILYRIDPDGAVTEWRRGIAISNTFAWNPEGTRFYFADTLLNGVDVYDYDRTSGSIANPRPFLQGFGRGLPDGSAMDSQGCLWNCRWGGGAIVRVKPDGAIDRVLEMPAANITSCTFGGPDFKTLYVTSAAFGAAPHRLAGALFAMETDVPGLAENRFAVRPE